MKFLVQIIIYLGLIAILEANIQSSADFNKLCNDYWKWRISDMPQYATRIGIHDYNTELNDMSEEAYRNRLETSRRFLQRANILEPFLVSEDDINNMRALKYELNLFADSWKYKGFYLPINYMEGPQTYDRTLFSHMPRSSYEDYKSILKRLEKLPKQIDQIIDLMKAGVKNNITLHSISLKNLNQTLGRFVVEDPKSSPYYKFFNEFPPNLLTAVEEIRNEALFIIKTKVSPAYDKLRKYIIKEYVPRKNIAITSIENGAKFYEACIWYQTSTNYSAEEIHNIGKLEIESLQKEMKKIATELGFANLTVQEFSNMIRNNPKNYFNDSTDLLNGFKKINYHLIPPRLSAVFNSVPKTELRVEGISNPGGMKAYYESSNLNGTIPGKFIFNSYDPHTIPKYNMLTLSLHEGQPGHHYQISQTLEAENLPLFRRFRDTSNVGTTPSRFPHYAFFVEGWALYAETLGFDMNLYENLLDRYGHYSARIFRACRLVVDTGLHAFGWTPDEALEFMFTRTASTRAALKNEIDRYVTWPGQALSYMIGEIKIRKLRKEAESKLGELFDLKDFHDLLYKSFRPFDQVEEQVRKWMNVGILFDKYWNWKLQDRPQFALRVGSRDYDGTLNEMSEESYENRLNTSKVLLQSTKIFEKTSLNPMEAVNLKVLKYELETFINNYHLKGFLMPLTLLYTPQILAKVNYRWMPLETYRDYEVMLNYMRNIPKQIDQIISLMRKGMENNITVHSSSIKPLNELLGEYIVENSENSPFFEYFSKNLPINFTEQQIQELKTEARSIISNQLVPSYETLRNFLFKEYVPRSEISVRTIKAGDEFYQAAIRFHTGTNMSASEIHKLGLIEVKKIAKKMEEIVKEMGHENMTAQQFSDFLRNDPKNYFNSSDEIIKRFQYIASEIIEPKLPLIFNRIPKAKMEIKGSNTSHGPKAFYMSPTLYDSRPGIFWANIKDLKFQPKYDMLTLSLHEGRPGHHLQISYTLESENMPNFRKVTESGGFPPSAFPAYSFYVEGWALYAETLGFDMGLFNDPLDRYGHYSMKMMRACRLVVDTGMHALGWTSEEALEYMIKNTASSKEELQFEIDRYISSPGQGLSYMIGEITITNLRREAEREMGSLYDLKDFHDIVLRSFGPFEIMEDRVRNWINKTIEEEKLFNDYWEWKLKDRPQFSTYVGIQKYNHLLDDLSESAFLDRYEKCEEFLRKVEFLESFDFENSNKINLKILRHELETYIDNFYLKGFYLPLNSLEGPHKYPETDFKRMPRKSHQDYLILLERMNKLPQQIDQIIDLMKSGMQNNITNHEASLKGLDTSLRNFIVDDPKMSPFYEKFFEKNFPENFTNSEILELQKQAEDVIINKVSPAYLKLHDFVTTEYTPRKHISITSIKNGEEFYQKLILMHTSSNLTAREIHEIGLKEVERIENEMKIVISQMRLKNVSVFEFSEKIRNDPQNFHHSDFDLLTGFEKIIEKIYPRLETLFHTTPKAKLEVVGDKSPHQLFASYLSGSFDGSQPGKFVISTFAPLSRPKYGMVTLALHEGVPGHHFQLSHLIESPKNPNFRKSRDYSSLGTSPSNFPAYRYFVEGWALYAESLGFDMQLFNCLLDRYGHYSAEMFRACRLVVDTGIHALGWTQQEAIDFMLRYTASPRSKIKNEIDRYITWPGQALNYKMGELKIRELRKIAEFILGKKFKIKDFHQVLLDNVGPFHILENQVQEWIRSQ